MATFYLLPPRGCLIDHLARFLPGLGLPADAWDRFAECVAPPGVYLIPRDDLPDGQPEVEALTDGFGAEPGDRVVEIPAGGGSGRVWVVPGVVSGSAAA